MRNLLIVTTASLAIISQIPVSSDVHAQESIKSYAPQGDWTVRKLENDCSLRRSFGSGKDEIKMRVDIRQNFFAQNVQITGEPIPRLPRQSSIKLLQNEKTGEPSVRFFLLKERPKNGARWTSTILNPSLVGQNQILDVLINDETQMRLPLKPSRKAIQAAADCQGQLLQQWGIDIAKYQNLSQHPRPKTNPVARFSWRDYPLKTRAGYKRNLITYKVAVDENGIGGDCTIVAPSKYPDLDKTICRIIDEDRNYTPALSKDGQSVAATHLQSIQWIVDSQGHRINYF